MPPPPKKRSTLPPPEVLSTPLLGVYEIEARIGRTPEAELLRARQVRPNAPPVPCLMKRLLPADPAETELRGRQIFGEGLVNMGLSHPNIVRVYDYGAHEGRVCLIRELIEGVSLHSVRTQTDIRRMPLPSLIYMAWQLADALTHAHEHDDADGAHIQLVHGRLSPAEVLVTASGQVKLTEMSLAASESLLVRMPGQEQAWRGRYLAPEQQQQRFVDPRSDLFSLGLILVELLAGRPLAGEQPVRAVDFAGLVREQLASRRDVPPELVELLGEMTALDPDRRPQLTRDVAKVFASCASIYGSRGELDAELARYLSRYARPAAERAMSPAERLASSFLDEPSPRAPPAPPKAELRPAAIQVQAGLTPAYHGCAPSLPMAIPTGPGAGRAAAASLLKAAHERSAPNLSMPAGIPPLGEREITGGHRGASGTLVLGAAQIEQLRTRTHAMMKRQKKKRMQQRLAVLTLSLAAAAFFYLRTNGIV